MKKTLFLTILILATLLLNGQVLWEDNFNSSNFKNNYDMGNGQNFRHLTSGGYNNSACVEITVVEGSHYGGSMRYMMKEKLGYEPEELYAEYKVRYSADMRTYGGKAPGFSGTYDKAGWGNEPGYGKAGWSARGTINCDNQNYVVNKWYVYHTYTNYDAPNCPGQTNYRTCNPFPYDVSNPGSQPHASEKTWGSGLNWGNKGDMQFNRWYTVKQYVKLNTPGQNNGILRAWVNGVKVTEFTNINFRRTNDLKIYAYWFNYYNGGSNTARETGHLRIDDFKLYTSDNGGNTCNPSTIKPYVLVDNGSWEQNTNITVASGKRVRFGPHPTSGGSWRWSGCGISGSDAAKRDPNIYPTSSCNITATHTNNCGAQSSATYRITVTGGGTPPSNAIAIPGRVEAEDYTNMNGIQTQNTSDAGGGKNVGWIGTNDWMDYKVNVQSAGSYTVKFRVASNSNNIKLDLKKGNTVLTSVNTSKTNGWQSWKTVTKTVNLSAGEQTLRVLATGAGWNINYMEFTSGSNSSSSGGSCTGAVLTVEAESFTNTSGTFNDGKVPLGANKNGSTINYVNNGDWMDYTVNVPSSGAYDVSYRISTPITGSTIQISSGGSSSTTTVPNNGQWDSYVNLNSSGTIDLSAGNQTIRLTAGAQTWTWNLDKFTLTCANKSAEGILPELSGMKLYPNPVSDELNIVIERELQQGASIMIYNSIGILVSSKLLNRNELRFTTNHLTKGMYIIRFVNGSEIITKRFIKE